MLHRVLNGHTAVSSNMDLRLSEALSTSPGYGLALQTQRDLWRVRELANNRPPTMRVFTRETAPALNRRAG